MEIQKAAMAGTLESSDAQVIVEPAADNLEVSVESSVMNQYGQQIKATVLETLEQLNVVRGKVTVIDKGALDCTIKARVQAAVLRSEDAAASHVPWGGVVK